MLYFAVLPIKLLGHRAAEVGLEPASASDRLQMLITVSEPLVERIIILLSRNTYYYH